MWTGLVWLRGAEQKGFPTFYNFQDNQKQMRSGITITILDISYCPVFYLKQDISGAGSCLCLQVESPLLGATDRASPVTKTSCYE
jgi:hypothetical protein